MLVIIDRGEIRTCFVFERKLKSKHYDLQQKDENKNPTWTKRQISTTRRRHPINFRISSAAESHQVICILLTVKVEIRQRKKSQFDNARNPESSLADVRKESTSLPSVWHLALAINSGFVFHQIRAWISFAKCFIFSLFSFPVKGRRYERSSNFRIKAKNSGAGRFKWVVAVEASTRVTPHGQQE
jgi:hypothetical protein